MESMNFSADTWWLFGLTVAAAIAIIGFFLKRTINQSDEHDKSINEIKRTYVTKDEMKDLKTDVNNTISKLQSDVEQIKDTCLTKKDFYANQNRLEAKIDKQNDKIDKQNQYILELLKGSAKND